MQTKHMLFAVVAAAFLGSTGVALAQGPGASGAAATLPERDVRPSMNPPAAAPGGMTTEPSATVGQNRNGTMAAPRQGMTPDSTSAVGTSNPQNSTSR
jgi:hypothetical protein